MTQTLLRVEGPIMGPPNHYRDFTEDRKSHMEVLPLDLLLDVDRVWHCDRADEWKKDPETQEWYRTGNWTKLEDLLDQKRKDRGYPDLVVDIRENGFTVPLYVHFGEHSITEIGRAHV